MVMNILCKSKFAENIVYNISRRALSYEIEQLYRRGLVRLSGEDVLNYLQGLVTNDVNRVDLESRALFTYFLNRKGRILFDALIYKRSQCDVLLECDIRIQDEMIEHLKMYRVRKKVEIEPFDGNVWSIFIDMIPSSNLEARFDESDPNSNYNKIAFTLSRNDVIAFQDPRLPSLGVRIFALSSTYLTEILRECGIRTVESNNYAALRYKLGVPEGISEIPTNKCFPMEMNCDYLNGVSFRKGCYIGQELTARTYYTGIVRKRIMPLILYSVPDREINYDSPVVTEDDQVVGKLKGIDRNYCIALLKISEALRNPSKLNVNGISACTYKPFWWPFQKSNMPEDSIS